MKPSNALVAIKHLHQVRRSAFIWGAPGGGKSAIVALAAKEQGIELRDVRVSLLDPTDAKGFPHIHDVEETYEVSPAEGRKKAVMGTRVRKQFDWIPPSFLPRSGEGMLFLDEMNTAPPAVQAAFYQLLTNRRIADYVLPDGWSVLAAGNRASDRAITNQQPSALANRFIHIQFETDMQDWSNWALAKGINDLVRGFIKMRPAMLHAFDPNKNDAAWPSPRSWEFVSDNVETGMPPEVELELIKGSVGEAAASEFFGYARVAREMPSADEILVNPDTAPVPPSPAGKYAISTALESVASANNLGRMFKYINRLDPEFQVLFVRTTMGAKRELTNTKDFTQWIAANQDLLV
jgi:hypothetical protein